MRRVRFYERYSSDEQDESRSIPAQDAANRELVGRHPDWAATGVYIDQALSATTTDRPELQRMLADARAREFDILVVHKLDRLTRSLPDLVLLISQLEKCDVLFVSATEPIDLTTPVGKLMLFVLGFLAEWYITNLSAETTKGKVARFSAGLWNGDLRFGYSRVKVGEVVHRTKTIEQFRPEPNSDAEGVRLAYAMCAQGSYNADVAAALTRAGFRTYRLIANAKTKAAPGTDPALRRPFTKSGVAALFNPEAAQFGHTTYTGEGERRAAAKAAERGERHAITMRTIKNTHPAILTRDEVDAAMQARASRVNLGAASNQAARRHVYLLDGAMVCAHCGGGMRATSTGSKTKRAYYQCAAHDHGVDCRADKVYVREDQVASQIDEMIARLSYPPDYSDLVLRLAAEDGQDADPFEHERATLEAELVRVKYQHRIGAMEDTELARAVRDIRTRQARLPSKPKPGASLARASDALAGTVAIWPHADKSERRALLRAILDKTRVDAIAGYAVSVRPAPEFVALFAGAGFELRDGWAVLG